MSTEITEAAPRGLLSGALRHGIMLIVVVGPLIALCAQLGGPLPFDRVSLGYYIAMAGLLVLCEHWLTFQRHWGSAVRGSLTDFLYVGVATALDKGTFLLCATVVATLGHQLSAAFGIALWPGHWPFAAQLLMALVIADIGTYFRHRLFHRVDFLWRFHQIHHSMTGLYWIRSAYTHPLEQLCIMLAIMFPMSLLGAGVEVLAPVVFLFGLSGLVQHANVDASSGWLNYLFATPEVHRVHHAANETGDRSNYSAFFVLMDHLFGTYVRPVRAEAPREVGLEGVSDFPSSFFTHLTLPFRRDPTATEPADAWRASAGPVSEPNNP